MGTADRITANLPSRDFSATADFYGMLGFEILFRDEGWMILTRGPMWLEFFPHPDLVPAQSWFSACIRTDDLEALRLSWTNLDLPKDPMGRPRDLEIIGGDGAPRFFAMIDPDGSLLRCIDNGSV